MPSDPDTYTGRCYCGASTVHSASAPLTVATCHCADCRRVSGAPVNTFAAFAIDQITFAPPHGAGFSINPAVRRWSCPTCGTPLAATYDYLPGQIYVPVGLFEEVDQLIPQSVSHTAARVAWIHHDDELPQSKGSDRDRLGAQDG